MLASSHLLHLTDTDIDMANPYLFVGMFNNRATILDPSQELVEIEIKRVEARLSLLTTDNKFKEYLEVRLENLHGYNK